MRIVAARERAVPIASEIRNAFIDFSQMTVSALVLVTAAIVASLMPAARASRVNVLEALRSE